MFALWPRADPKESTGLPFSEVPPQAQVCGALSDLLAVFYRNFETKKINLLYPCTCTFFCWRRFVAFLNGVGVAEETVSKCDI